MPTTNYAFPTLVALMLSCSEQRTALPTDPGAGRGASVVSNALSSPGWQKQARNLVAAKKWAAYAAPRLYAMFGVSQYRAVIDFDAQFASGQLDADGQLASAGLDAGGRSRLETRRGAVARASARVLSYFFADRAETFDQRVEMEATSHQHPVPGKIRKIWRRVPW